MLNIIAYDVHLGYGSFKWFKGDSRRVSINLNNVSSIHTKTYDFYKKKEITKTEKYWFFFTREYTIKTEVYDSKELMYIVKMNNGDKFFIDYDIRMLINTDVS